MSTKSKSQLGLNETLRESQKVQKMQNKFDQLFEKTSNDLSSIGLDLDWNFEATRQKLI